MEKYRPDELEIKDMGCDGFKIVDPDLELYQLATVLEFNPINSDLPTDEIREFAQYLINYYNTTHK